MGGGGMEDTRKCGMNERSEGGPEEVGDEWVE